MHNVCVEEDGYDKPPQLKDVSMKRARDGDRADHGPDLHQGHSGRLNPSSRTDDPHRDNVEEKLNKDQNNTHLDVCKGVPKVKNTTGSSGRV